jgi:hypothetical protein
MHKRSARDELEANLEPRLSTDPQDSTNAESNSMGNASAPRIDPEQSKTPSLSAQETASSRKPIPESELLEFVLVKLG